MDTLERVCARVGYPRTIRIDQGSALGSRDLDLWAYANDVTPNASGPASPPTTHPGSVGGGLIHWINPLSLLAFNGRVRAECPSASRVLTLADAREWMGDWPRYRTEDRPRGAIGCRAPLALANPGSRTGQVRR